MKTIFFNDVFIYNELSIDYTKKYLYQDIQYKIDEIAQKQSTSVRASQKIKDRESSKTSCR